MAQSSLTRAEVAVLVATELGMLDLEAGEALSLTAQTQIIEAIDRHREGLIEMERCTWTEDAIPKSISDFIAMIIADRVQTKFSKVYGRGAEGELRLMAMLSKLDDGVLTKAKFF